MQVTNHCSILADPALDAADSARVPKQVLDQSDFLKLLITQMTSQDPLNPKSDLDSIAQMAQFSALEQSKTMQTDMAQLSNQQQILQATSLIGSTVELKVDSDTTASGVVDSVTMSAGTPMIVVGGVAYDLSQLQKISPTVVSPQP